MLAAAAHGALAVTLLDFEPQMLCLPGVALPPLLDLLLDAG